MKKNFKLYLIIWFSLLLLFNLLVFIIPAWPALEKFTASFWIGYSFTIIAFMGQIICAWLSFKADSAKKTFYNISLIRVSYTGLISTFIFSLICMIVAPIPYWITTIVCTIILAINVSALAKTQMAIDLVNDVDKKIETATSFIYEMREESESLLARAKTEDISAICKKIRDAFKFSDPMSSEELSSVEIEIKNHFDLVCKSVKEGKMDVISTEADEVLALIVERNSKCKRLK